MRANSKKKMIGTEKAFSFKSMPLKKGDGKDRVEGLPLKGARF